VKKGSDKPLEIDLLMRDLPLEEANRLLDVWEAAGDSDAGFVRLSEDEIEGALARFNNAADDADRNAGWASARASARPVSAGRLRRVGGFVGIAAAFCLVVAIATATFFRLSQPIEKSAPHGSIATISLPDGSTVELNSGSTVRYPRRFGLSREVVLNGEAFFNVIRDERPFEVNTYDASVRVLGTRFNVRSWRHALEVGTTVALESGSVVLVPVQKPAAAVTLSPGQSWRVGSSGPDMLSEELVSVADATAWRDGDLVYRDTPIAVVIADVERRYGVRVLVNPPGAANERFSLALRQPKSAADVLSDIAAAVGMSYRERSDGFELFREN
jgi:ferric-dicitrate binding protein FerR (iron transport regulator)